MNCKNLHFPVFLIFSLPAIFSQVSFGEKPHTIATIIGEDFYINGGIGLKDRSLNGITIKGFLPDSRMAKGIFDVINPDTMNFWINPGSGKWYVDRNKDKYVAAMPKWRNYGLPAFTTIIQGGSPIGNGNIKECMNPDLYKDNL